jgi:hypothetical protein
VKFRRGGTFEKAGQLILNGHKIEFVSSFCYLRVELQPTGVCFATHIKNRANAARRVSYEIKALSKISVRAALELFDGKVAPMASYAIDVFWELLSKKNFELLESNKSGFLKRLLCLHISTKSRLIYPLVDTLFFVEEIQFNLNKSVQYQEFIASQYATIFFFFFF